MQPGGPLPESGQRRLLTVLFSDVCGSTQLGRRLEPEELLTLVSTLREVAAEEIGSRQGTVIRAQGDGILAVFGLDAAGEHDGVLAAELALALHQKMPQRVHARLGLDELVQLRSGIHLGNCLVSQGNLLLGVVDVQGDAVNTAAYIQHLAGKGGVVASTAALGPNLHLFETRPVLRIPLRPGESAPPATEDKLPSHVQLVQVLGRRTLQRRYDATAQRGLTPFMAREAALDFLLRSVAAEDVAGRCSVIQGGPGIGKTRLLEEFLARAGLSGWQVLRGNCESFGQAEVLQPFVQMVRGREVRPAIEDLQRYFEEVHAAGRVLMVIDDWQWADDASRQLLVALLDRLPGLRVVLAARLRADGENWIAGAHHFTLTPFELPQTEAAVERWMPGTGPFEAARVHAYAGGVPLFVEELCHSGAAKPWDAEPGRGPAQTWLNALVASRLALLTRTRPQQALLLRAGAVIGNAVPLPLLRKVCDVPVTRDMLDELAASDLLYAEPGTELLRFKHGITRDAVYQAIGLYERMDLHRRIEQALLARGDGVPAADDLEALASHARGARHWESAARFAELAGDHAAAANAVDRARVQYHAALEALDQLPRSDTSTARWCAVAAKLGMACIFDTLALGEDINLFEQAVLRARGLGDTELLARAQYWLAYIRYGLGDFRSGIGHGREALQLALAAGQPRLAAQIRAMLGQVLAAATEYDEALALMGEALEAKRRTSSGRAGSGVAVGSAYTLACYGSVLADRGVFGEAHACFDEALRLLGTSLHPVGNSVRNWVAVALIWEERWDDALRVAEESARIAENTRTLLLLAVSRTVAGYARWRLGSAAGLQQMQDALGWMEKRNVRFFASLLNGWLCEAAMQAGRRDAGRKAAGRVLASTRDGERLGEAVACRVLAQAAAGEGRPRAARAWLRRAEASAQARGSRREQRLNAAVRATLVVPAQELPVTA